MATAAFVRTRQSLRTLDEDALEAASAAAAAAMARIEARREALGWSQGRLQAAACVNRSTYERAISGVTIPENATLQKLFSALLDGERQARRRGADRGGDLAVMFVTTCRLAALAFGQDPEAVIAVRPADNRPRDRVWLARVHAKHAAAYALVMTDRVSMTAIAELVGVSKQAVSDALRAVEDRLEDPEFAKRLQLVGVTT